MYVYSIYMYIVSKKLYSLLYSLKKIVSHTTWFCNLAFVLSILWTPFHVSKYHFTSCSM